MLNHGLAQSEDVDECWRRGLEGCPPEDPVTTCSKIDLVVVFGPGNDSPNDVGPWQTALNDLKLFADQVDADYTDYRLGFVVVRRLGSVTVEESMALNNASSFKTAVDGVADVANWTYASDINGGLETAIDGTAGVWRSGDDVQRVVILVSDSVPGGNNDTYSAADETDLESHAATGLAATDSITTHTMRTAWSDDGDPIADPGWTELGRILDETATVGGGTFNTFIDGAGLSLAYYLWFLVLENVCVTSGDYAYGDTSHLKCCRTTVEDLCIRFECYGEDDLNGDANCKGDGHHLGDFGHDGGGPCGCVSSG